MKSSEFSESSAVGSKGNAAAPIQSRCSPVLTPLAYFLGRHLVVPAYFGPVTITGQQRVPTSGPVILAPTHRARWDSILLPYAVGRPTTGRDLRFMVTADEVRGLQGWFIRRLGGFAVNVRRPTVASLRYGIDLLLGLQVLPVDMFYGEAYPGWRCPVQIHIGEPLLVQSYLKGQDTPEVLKAGAQQLTRDLQTQLEAMVANRQAIAAAAPSLPAQP